MRENFDDVQRIVLHGTRWNAARHLMLAFGEVSPLRFLNGLLDLRMPTPAKGPKPSVQFSLGFTRSGLEGANVPEHVLACFALKSPAYWAGAALRAASHLGMSDRNAAQCWDPRFAYTTLDAVLSVHAANAGSLVEQVNKIKSWAQENGLKCTELPPAAALTAPPGVSTPGQWVHFGFLDGLSRIGIKGWTKQDRLKECLPTSQHEAGEFVLGHVQDCGANPWVAGPGLRIWPAKVRPFFHNGSFGVLQQIEQDVAAFERFVNSTAKKTGLCGSEIKGKLCGRYPDGRPLAAPGRIDPRSDFDYTADPDGYGCPFGSHVRRMNPRVPRSDVERPSRAPQATQSSSPPTELELARFPAHFSQARPLLRRSLPYGPAWMEGLPHDEPRGLIGQFFCASIEDQYEHLVGEWADRVPLGSPDAGGARDPLSGAHEAGDGPFEIPQNDAPPMRLDGLRPFTRTIGAAYLFYPSLTTLRGIAESSLWGLDDKGDDA